MSQEWAIAQWRKDRAANDPAPYQRRADGAVWCSVNQNEGWYFRSGNAVFPEGNPFFNVAKWISPKQLAKIA